MQLPFPADSADFEEYTSVMNAMADEAQASAPDPEPDDAPDDTEYWSQGYERGDDGGEDSHLDSMYEDVSEYGMEGCCGDF
jgi:hypothetical protein